jgi:hypothetical protein
MVEPNPKNRLAPQQYARLKSEMAAPYRGLRKFIYIACAASGFIGAFSFFFKLLAGQDVESTLPNFFLQIAVISLMVWLWRWEQRRENASK